MHRRLAHAATINVIVLLLMVGAAPVRGQDGAGVAIVVHPSSSVTDIPLGQLRRIFMADQQFWADGSRITLFVRAPAAYERDVVLNVIYRMSEDEFRKYWVGKMFRAEVPSGPKIVYSSEMAGELVTAVPGAIAFVPAGDVIPGVRVVRIDGRLPSDADYPLR